MASTPTATSTNDPTCRFRLRSLTSDMTPTRCVPDRPGRRDPSRDGQVARWFVSLCDRVLSGRCPSVVLHPHIAPTALGQWRRLQRWVAAGTAGHVSLRPSRISRGGTDRIELVAMLASDGRQRVVSLTLGRVADTWRLTGCRLI